MRDSPAPLKVVVIGPESTGKSTLCRELAEYYGTSWCPEYAREYLTNHGTAYTYEDLLTIAQGQIRQEEETIDAFLKTTVPNGSTNPRPVFIDTDMYVMKVWCEFVFGRCHRFILDQINSRSYDLYLLCATDLPWTRDALREYPDLQTRETLFRMYLDCMVNQSVAWSVIRGNEGERLRHAIDAVDACIREQVSR